MLVVIVVAAATAFSFFVAAYQKQLQAQETLTHDRNLEAVKVIGITEVLCSSPSAACEALPTSPGPVFADVSFTVASLDVNPISIASLFVNQHPVVNFTVLSPGPTDPCYDAANRTNATHGLAPCSIATIPSLGRVTFTLNLDDNASGLCLGPPPSTSCNGYFAFGPYSDLLSPSTDILLQVLTSLGNQFTVAFAPPVPVVSVFFVSAGLTSAPVFDGLGSYQPPEADNTSILWYNWSITNVSGGAVIPTCGVGGSNLSSGGEFECAGMVSGTYSVTLEVTNTDGLTAVAKVPYSQS